MIFYCRMKKYKGKYISKKAGLKLNTQKWRSWYLVPSLHADRWGKNGNSDRLYFLGPKSLWVVTTAMKLKDACFLEEKLYNKSRRVCVLSCFSCIQLLATPWTVVHGILQARILEWVAISSSQWSSRPRDHARIAPGCPVLQVDSLPLSHPGSLTNLDSTLKSRDIILPTKVHIVKAVVFPVVMYRCESWAIKKAEHWRIDAFKLWCFRRLLRVSWTTRRSN